MAKTIRFEFETRWQYQPDPESGLLVAHCDALHLTVEANALPELAATILEAQNAYFCHLYQDGLLEEFLMENGIAAETVDIPSDVDCDDLTFDIPPWIIPVHDPHVGARC
ncbi:MAG: hypothetical protein SF182_05425 [Deltaproteobacteria bacterium]|nr:hypothetical protein [Deltaproteobacteria bacterium]